MAILGKLKFIKIKFKKLQIASPTFHRDGMSKTRTMKRFPHDTGQDKAEEYTSLKYMYI